MWINRKNGYLQDWITQVWVKLTGRRIDPEHESWLTGPIGDTRLISDKFIADLAIRENLDIRINTPGSGLLSSFDELELSPEERARVQPAVVDFYERTLNYGFDIENKWNGFFRIFGWMLSILFSKRLQQLNLPLRKKDTEGGIQSNIIKLCDKTSGTPRWTIWYRTLKSSGNVVFSGIYSTGRMPGIPEKVLKVIFPLPNGNATVFMQRRIPENGSLQFSSAGKRFGNTGFYFTLTNHKDKFWSRYVPPMHEKLTVYVNEENELRADHHFLFYKIVFLRLHYRIKKK